MVAFVVLLSGHSSSGRRALRVGERLSSNPGAVAVRSCRCCRRRLAVDRLARDAGLGRARCITVRHGAVGHDGSHRGRLDLGPGRDPGITFELADVWGVLNSESIGRCMVQLDLEST